jgi:hypothetical protein
VKTFYGELYVEDPNCGNNMLYVLVGENTYGETVIELHNANPPNSLNTFVGRYGDYWSLKKINWKLLVTVYELTFLQENPPVKVRCVTGHKFGKMLEAAIETLKKHE